MHVIYSLLASLSSFSNGHENIYHRFHVVHVAVYRCYCSWRPEIVNAFLSFSSLSFEPVFFFSVSLELVILARPAEYGAPKFKLCALPFIPALVFQIHVTMPSFYVTLGIKNQFQVSAQQAHHPLSQLSNPYRCSLDDIQWSCSTQTHRWQYFSLSSSSVLYSAV